MNKAALSSFVRENKMGISIDSLSELNQRLRLISREEYQEMKKNTRRISDRLATGYYLKQALANAEQSLNKD